MATDENSNVVSKHNLILDLDENIINAKDMERFFKKLTPEHKEKAEKFEVHNCDGYFIIFERPNLQEFLDYAFENFNVSVWTAASKDYALFIINDIILQNKPERKLDYVFFSYHCGLSEEVYSNESKNLKLFWEKYKLDGYNENNTFIMEDNDKVIKSNPVNSIQSPEFIFKLQNSENDTFLKDVITTLDKIKDADSVQDVLKK